MGTNYYLRRHIRPSKIQEIKDLVTEENIYNNKLKESLEEFKEIHIGKSSYGWQFLFNHNNRKYYQTNRDSINSFLEKEINNGGFLVDEYENSINLKDFWNLVDSKKGGFDSKSNYYYELNRWNCYKNNPDEFKNDIIKPSYPHADYLNFPEILDDGLRFSFFTDFS